MYIYGMHINPYEKGNIFNKDPLRARRLLMHRTEISRLDAKMAEKGYTLGRCRCTLKAAWLRWKWAWPEAKSSTTSGRP